MNKSRLRMHIALRGVSQDIVADELGIARSTMSFKLNGKSQFTLREIRKICKFLELTSDEVYEVFIK